MKKSPGIIEVTDEMGRPMQVRKSAIKAVIWADNKGGFIKGIWQTGFFELLPSKQDRGRWNRDWYSLYSTVNPFDPSDTRAARVREADKKDRKVQAAAIRKAKKDLAWRRAKVEESAAKHRLRHERYLKEGSANGPH